MRPNDLELYFLNQAYNFFLDILEETNEKSFWEKDSYYRFNRIKDAFLVYSEILEYEPFEWFFDFLKKQRPPEDAEMSKDFLLFIRNLLIHFPLFRSWDDVKFSRNLINWSKPGQRIDRFMSSVAGKEDYKSRIWDPKNQKMTYVTIKFPITYANDDIYLKNFVSEKDGVRFSMALMFRVLASQVDGITSDEGK